ncbi:MAG: hypothetical protein H0V82_01450 [Candidatus Protochlamydia sp.]|nr:hypothetical protein [Candidatus Protochlamydia sp.]
MATINATKEISLLHSAKIFINIECNNRRFSQDRIISGISSFHMPKSHINILVINPILFEAKVFLGVENVDRFNSKWVALLKDNEGVFRQAGGSIECSHINGTYQMSEPTSKGRSIDPGHLQEYFNIVLERMGRETAPQLDDQQNFI